MPNLTHDQLAALTAATGRRLAVFGSRTLDDERVAETILEAVDAMKPSAIVTAAEPHGVCEVARRVAAYLPVPLHLHFLDRAHRAAGAWHWRSTAVYRNADRVLLIHDGQSQGTSNELALAIKTKMPYTYVKLEADVADADQ